MERTNLENMLLSKFPALEDVRVHSVTVNTENLEVEIELLLPEKPQNEQKISVFLSEAFKAPISLKCTKNHFDEDFLRIRIAKFFEEENSFLKNNKAASEFQLVSAEDGTIQITFFGNRSFCGYVESSLSKALVKYLHRCFLEKFEIFTSEVATEEEEQAKKSEKEIRALLVTDLKEYLGKMETEVPAFICDIDGEYDRAVLAGKIGNFQKKKRTKIPDFVRGEPNENFYIFELTDPSASITCAYFPSKSNDKKASELDGKEVVLTGRIKVGRSGDFELMVKTVTSCKIVTSVAPKNKMIKDEPLYYSTVSPEPLVIYEQESAFDKLEKKKALDLSKLQNKTIVVFDLETTGLSPIRDKIVEIGAVKIVDGKFTEKFSTLIDPEMEMSEENIKIHGITNEQVKGKPKIEDVIIDFYKFSYGSILCGHNVKGFDMKFINEKAKDVEYKFTNPIIDTLDLAIKYVRGMRNNKLDSLCKRFGIVNDCAHRAYEDAISTGRVLMNIVSEIEEAEI